MEKGRVREGGDKGSQSRGGPFSATRPPFPPTRPPFPSTRPRFPPTRPSAPLFPASPTLHISASTTLTFQPPRPSPHKLSSSHRFNSNSNAHSLSTFIAKNKKDNHMFRTMVETSRLQSSVSNKDKAFEYHPTMIGTAQNQVAGINCHRTKKTRRSNII